MSFFAAVPPLITSDAQFTTAVVNTNLKTSGNAAVANGYVTPRGTANILNGNTVVYTAGMICDGVVIRTGLSGNAADTLPSATAIAAQLGLDATDGISYIRYLSMYNNNSSYTVTYSGTGWTFYTSAVLTAQHANVYALQISYSANSGWAITAVNVATTVLS